MSGLVVERLHSRLAILTTVCWTLSKTGSHRSTTFSREVVSRVAALLKGQEALSTQTRDLVAASHNASDMIYRLCRSAVLPVRWNLCVPTIVTDLISVSSRSGKGASSLSRSLPPRFDGRESLSTSQHAPQDKASELLVLSAAPRCPLPSHGPPRRHDCVHQGCAARTSRDS